MRKLFASMNSMPPDSCRGRKRCPHLLVEREQMLDALALGSKPGPPVEPAHCAVEHPVRSAQVRRHQIGIVEIGERGSVMGCEGVQYGLG